MVQNIGISGFMNFDILGLFLYLHVRMNRYNKIQSGIIKKISLQNIKVLNIPEYSIQYNRIKTNNLSPFIGNELFFLCI